MPGTSWSRRPLPVAGRLGRVLQLPDAVIRVPGASRTPCKLRPSAGEDPAQGRSFGPRPHRRTGPSRRRERSTPEPVERLDRLLVGRHLGQGRRKSSSSADAPSFSARSMFSSKLHPGVLAPSPRRARRLTSAAPHRRDRARRSPAGRWRSRGGATRAQRLGRPCARGLAACGRYGPAPTASRRSCRGCWRRWGRRPARGGSAARRDLVIAHCL